MDWIPIGKLTKTHGLKGELKFFSFVTDEEILQFLHRVKTEDDLSPGRELEIKSIRGNPSNRIIKFKGIDSIESAKNLVGSSLLVQEDDFQPLPEGEFYWFQIEGLRTYDMEGKFYGRVEEIIHTGSNEVYVVRDGEKEILLPMIDSVVQTVDLEAGKLIFKKVEGLIEETPV